MIQYMDGNSDSFPLFAISEKKPAIHTSQSINAYSLSIGNIRQLPVREICKNRANKIVYRLKRMISYSWTFTLEQFPSEWNFLSLIPLSSFSCCTKSDNHLLKQQNHENLLSPLSWTTITKPHDTPWDSCFQIVLTIHRQKLRFTRLATFVQQSVLPLVVHPATVPGRWQTAQPISTIPHIGTQPSLVYAFRSLMQWPNTWLT